MAPNIVDRLVCSRGAGNYVDLRAERDVLAVLSNCPQMHNPCNAYNLTPIRAII